MMSFSYSIIVPESDRYESRHSSYPKLQSIILLVNITYNNHGHVYYTNTVMLVLSFFNQH